MGLVAYPSAALLALLFGSLGDIGLDPFWRRGSARLELGDAAFELNDLLTELLIGGEMRGPFLLGEGDEAGRAESARAERGRPSRI